ncbi:MAG: hypothetical protein ACI9S8_003159 [Chlamydiales bacterium]
MTISSNSSYNRVFNDNSKFIENHLQEKLQNHSQWLEKTLSQAEPEKFFPYYADNEKTATATVLERTYNPRQKNISYPLCEDSKDEDPLFLVNTPFVPKTWQEGSQKNLSLNSKKWQKDNCENLVNCLEKIASESFGKTEAFSRKESKRKLAIVVGMNCPLSLDNNKNRDFIGMLRNVATVESISYRCFGFFWKPLWCQKEGMGKKTYPIEKAFLLIKLLKPQQAAKVRAKLEGNLQSQIPFQNIREKIFKGTQTQDFFRHFAEKGGDAPVYFSCLDDDFVSLRHREGLYSTYSKLISDGKMKKGKYPKLLSTGYTVQSGTQPLIKIAVDMERMVRAATAKHIPLGPYYPEPNFIFQLDYKLYKDGKYSFKGAGKSLESRRFIQNAMKVTTLDASNVIFYPHAPLLTRTPARMVTKKIIALGNIDSRNIKQKGVLTGLRSISQSHAFPKQWADNLYIALPVSTKVTNVTQPLMNIHNSFSPISLMMSWEAGAKKYSSKNFDAVNKLYLSYSQNLSEALVDSSTSDLALNTFIALGETASEKKTYRTFFETHQGILVKAFSDLKKEGLSQEWIGKICKAAKGSGAAMLKSLRGV